MSEKINIGLIGLGKMGANLAYQMMDEGLDPVVYNRTAETTLNFIERGFRGVFSLEELMEELPTPRAVWLMVPSGQAVDALLEQLMPYLSKADLLIDGGNSNYKDTLRRAEMCAQEGLHYLDIGTSGGVSGARHGACMMVGGEREAFERIEPYLKKLCVPGGLAHVGTSGSGHFVKMIHNGIEYGMMQAIAEGFEILKASDFDLELDQVAEVWRHGSIVASYLMDITALSLKDDPDLTGLSDKVDSSGEGLWSLEAALEAGVPAYVLSAALFKRYESQQAERYSNKLLAAMRHGFGGHAVHRAGE